MFFAIAASIDSRRGQQEKVIGNPLHHITWEELAEQSSMEWSSGAAGDLLGSVVVTTLYLTFRRGRKA